MLEKKTLKSKFGNITIEVQKNKITRVYWSKIIYKNNSIILNKTKKQFVEYFKGIRKKFNLRIDYGHKKKSKKILNIIEKIPYGKTKSYSEIARLCKTSPRAVGRVCAKNKIPIIIPCHRVVSKNGALTGYSGGKGIYTKKILLELELGK